MDYLFGFLFVGLLCMLGQIIVDSTKLTPGHVTSLYVVIGSFLGFLGLYDYITLYVGVAASLPITSFGNQLYLSAINGYLHEGWLGVLSNMLLSTGAGITSAVLFSFFLCIIFKPKQ